MSNQLQRKETNQASDVLCVPLSGATQSPLVVDANYELEMSHDFEEAVDATGYGLYNYLLLLAYVPGGWSSAFDMTIMSYVLPSAECDLKLTLFHKGVLNAITYAGMMSSAFIWGFLADTRGRHSLLRIGYLADAICNIMCSMSQSFYVLVTFKFLTGFIVNGPFAINMTYLAEFHSTKHRSRTLLWACLSSTLGTVVLPILAWAVIPQHWSFTLFEGAFVFNSWRIFILVCSMPPLLAFLALFYFPESPKFLMTQGKNDEALRIFQKMYSMNTGNPPEEYPVKALCQDDQKREIESSSSQREISISEKARHGWVQIKPLFRKPYLCQFLLVTAVQFGGILSLNTLRLWMPQLFAMMENFDYKNRDPSLGFPTLCEVISLPDFSNATMNDDFNSTIIKACVVAPVHSNVYINSIIIASATVIGYTFAGNLVNVLGKKNLLLILYSASAVCSIAVNWSPNSDVTLAVMSVYMGLTSISISVVINIIVELMPTSLRAMAVSMTMCIGRGGAVFGNLLFPILLSSGCIVPFAFVGGFLIICFMMTIFIPNPPEKLT